MDEQLAKTEEVNILVVEDDLGSYLLITEYLKPYGFNLFHATNDTETWDLLNSVGAFHLVLMDVKLPCRVNGIDLSAQIKIRFPNLPIMIQTAAVAEQEPPDSIPGVYDGFIAKPYRMNYFRGKVLLLVDKAL